MKKTLFAILILVSFLLLARAPLADVAAKNDFQNLNGFMWFYNTWEDIRFNDIRANLDHLRSRGIRVIGIYAPYKGDKEKWLGCAPFDFFTTPPKSGTVEDFENLVRAAHERGMKVVTYFTNIFIDHRSDFFVKAQAQYKAGNRGGREASAVRWTQNPKDKLPEPSAGPDGKWKFSQVAGAYYWSLWGEVGFDFNLPGARAEVERAMKFWLDKGVDGFMFDAAFVHPLYKHHLVDLLKTHTTNDKWITFESTESEKARQYDSFGLTSWFNLEDNDHVNDYGLVARGRATMIDLEESLQNSDRARSLGKTTHAWTKWETESEGEENESPEDKAERQPYENDELMRVQEAALLAGAGILYGAPTYSFYMKWSPSLRANWERVLVTVNANPALLPSASRKRVPSGHDKKVYAMKRTSADGSQTALLIYNFRSTPAKITLDLKETGIARKQIPMDLYNGGTADAISGSSYTIELPAWGFRILQVSLDR